MAVTYYHDYVHEYKCSMGFNNNHYHYGGLGGSGGGGGSHTTGYASCLSYTSGTDTACIGSVRNRTLYNEEFNFNCKLKLCCYYIS